MRTCMLRLLPCLLIALSATEATAAGEEQHGNEPLQAANYTGYPNLLPLLNLKTRVYYQWVNGNEACYYDGNMEAVNEALAKFAAVEQDVHEVVLRPGPATISSFDDTKETRYRFKVQWLGGIAAHLTTRDKGHLVWNRQPVLTIYVDDETDLDQLRVPDQVRIVDTSELGDRCRQGLSSTDTNVRGWSCGVLAAIDRFDTRNMDAIAELLRDEEDWVRLNAVGALGTFGDKAKKYVPAMEALAAAGDDRLRQSAERSVSRIQSADGSTLEEDQHLRTQARIDVLLERRK